MRIHVLAASFAACVAATTAALAEETTLSDASADTGAAAAIAPFDEQFTAFEGPRPDLAVPETAVDLDTIEPPVEAGPDARPLGSGVASYYGAKFHGRPTASGERFDMHAMTAAHRTLPFGTKVLVTNPNTGASVVVRINDRGPFHHARTIDVSRAAATELGLVQRGHGKVELAVLD